MESSNELDFHVLNRDVWCVAEVDAGTKRPHGLRMVRDCAIPNHHVLLSLDVDPWLLGRCADSQVLDDLTPEDARWVYEAIRMAGPGGIGAVDQADVVGAAPRCLREAMALAASRDTVACQYATSFQHVFEVANRLETLPPPLDQAIVTAHLEQMAHEPDTLIGRKCGPLIAEEARGRAERVLAAGWPDSFESREAFAAFDRWLREDGHRRNPGTSADLIAAGLYVALEQDLIQLPVPWLENLGEEEVVGIGIGE